MAIPGIGGLFRFFGTGFTKLFSSFLRIRLFWFFTFFLIINAILIGFANNDAQFVIDDLGNRFLSPILSLKETSAQIIENDGLVFVDGIGFFSELFNAWGYLSSFWIIYFELSVLTFLIKKFPVADDSKGFTSFLIAIGVFFGIQMLYLSSQGFTIWEPFLSFLVIFEALPHIISPIAKIGDFFTKGEELVKNTSELMV